MSNFQRENRYYVLKIKNLTEAQDRAFHLFLRGFEIPELNKDCVVVESDWPMYNATWKAIQDYAEGNPPARSMQADEFRAFLDLLMCSDPYPCDTGFTEVMNFADRMSQEWGFSDWVEAYHKHTV